MPTEEKDQEKRNIYVIYVIQMSTDKMKHSFTTSIAMSLVLPTAFAIVEEIIVHSLLLFHFLGEMGG